MRSSEINNSQLRISARKSDLARLQAYRVGEALKTNKIDVNYSFRESLGDINQQDPLWKMPEKGVFTQDFLRDLVEETADLIVHSWKDLPTEKSAATCISATLPRADLRDVLLFRKNRMDHAKKTAQIRILTSSPRRIHNLKEFLKGHLPFRCDVEFVTVRGNIPTRLKKLCEQEVDGLIVAKAALDRLLEAHEPEFSNVQNEIHAVLAQTRFMVLPLAVNPTAAAQGAIAIEVLKKRSDLSQKLMLVNCDETFTAVSREREILASYGGGCHQKIGVSVLRRPYGEITFLCGLTDDGRVLNSTHLNSAMSPSPRAENIQCMFPRRDEEPSLFQREMVSNDRWKWAEKEKYLMVARETAWPENFSAAENSIVWTAGLRTWKKLAERGVWVSGSAEGLGEAEASRIETLQGCERNQKLDWVKLTHEDSASNDDTEAGLRTCATYRLIKKMSELPELKNRSHFFWNSGSAFERALELEPSIVRPGTFHGCGPGQTYSKLRKKIPDSLGKGASLRIYLSIEDWRSQVSPHETT